MIKNGQYDVEGMHCAACANAIERVLNKKDSVSASVNYATEKIDLSYDNQKYQFSDLQQMVRDAGYDITDEKSLKVKENEKQKELEQYRRHFLVAALFSVLLLYVAMGGMLGIWQPSFLKVQAIAAPIQLVLVLPIMFYAGRSFYSSGIRGLIKAQPNMDSLVALGSLAGFGYSLYSLYLIESRQGIEAPLYFESSGIIITFILLGKLLEAQAKGRASNAIQKLTQLQPKTARIFKDGKEEKVPIDQIGVGDTLIVKPGEKIALDGQVIKGHSSVDEKMLTGESLPVSKDVNDKVFASSLNQDGVLSIKVTGIGDNTMLAQIIKLVEEAQGKKAPIARLADRVSAYFVPTVMAIAFLVGGLWLLAGYSFSQSLSFFVAVLVIACPCALGLATPTSILVGSGKGASQGILIKSGQALEIAGQINTVVMDKTGTLTYGDLSLSDVITFINDSQSDVLQLAASLEQHSNHPVAKAIVKAAQKEGEGAFLKANEVKNKSGYGIGGFISGKAYFIGNKAYLQKAQISLTDKELEQYNHLVNEGKTVSFLLCEEKIIALFALTDCVRPDSSQAINRLKKLGIEVMMLTGDNQKAADFVARQLDIDHVISEVLPADKASVISQLQSEQKKVAMIGDGINDSPALAQADLGVAIGGGEDIAFEASDVVLIKSDLMGIPKMLQLSRLTMKNIKENLFWAFIYNLLGIPLAAGVLFALFGGPILNPMFAALAMSFSSVSVLLNALRLSRVRLDK